MYREIVVALDGTTGAEDALPVAGAMARSSGAHLELVRVVPRLPQGAMSVEQTATAQGDAIEQAEAYLAGVARSLRRADLSVDWTVLPGDAVRGIFRAAKDVDADLIMLSSGRLDSAHDLEGSVALKIVRLATCPVFVVSPRSQGRASAVGAGRAHRR